MTTLLNMFNMVNTSMTDPFDSSSMYSNSSSVGGQLQTQLDKLNTITTNSTLYIAKISAFLSDPPTDLPPDVNIPSTYLDDLLTIHNKLQELNTNIQQYTTTITTTTSTRLKTLTTDLTIVSALS